MLKKISIPEQIINNKTVVTLILTLSPLPIVLIKDLKISISKIANKPTSATFKIGSSCETKVMMLLINSCKVSSQLITRIY